MESNPGSYTEYGKKSCDMNLRNNGLKKKTVYGKRYYAKLMSVYTNSNELMYCMIIGHSSKHSISFPLFTCVVYS